METQVTLKLKELIKQKTGVDINKVSRKREIIEARAIYYKILKQIDNKKTLQSIGETVGKDHSTVLYSLNNYDMFEKFNPNLKVLRKQILSNLNYNENKNEIGKDNEIYNLNLEIAKLKENELYLQEQINKLQRPRNEYQIITNIENLLLDTEKTEQQSIILQRLEALYKMNKNIKL